MTLVVDASVVVPACGAPNGFAEFGADDLAAPPLMWSEARSVIHLALWQGRVQRADGELALSRLEESPVRKRDHRRLGYEAWQVAEELGLGKTYDAEYVALARLLQCRLVTLDARLRRRAGQLAIVVSPSEL